MENNAALPIMLCLTPKLRGNYAKHYCPLERTVRLGREGKVLHFMRQSTPKALDEMDRVHQMSTSNALGSR